MLLPFFLAAVPLIYGGKKIHDAASNLKEKNRVEKHAESLYKREKSTLKSKRRNTKTVLENLGKLKFEIYRDSIVPFIEIFSQIKSIDFKEIPSFGDGQISINKNDLTKFKKVPFEVQQMISIGIVAFGIGGLTTLALSGIIFASKAKTAKENAYANLQKAKLAAAKMKEDSTTLDFVFKSTKELTSVLKKLNSRFDPLLEGLENLVNSNNDYRTYSEREKVDVFWAVATAKTIKNLLEVQVIDENGSITQNCLNTIQKTKNIINELPVE